MKKFLSLVLGFSLMGAGLVSAESVLSDIDEYEYAESIEFLYDGSILDGYNDGTFKPENKINRAEFTKVVINSVYDIEDLEGLSDDCFPDVKSEDWFSPYVCLAQEEGIIQGYPDGTFKPGNDITQAEALKIIYESFYGDIQDLGGEWYQRYLDAAEFDGMLYFEATNSPAAHVITRGEVSYFLAWLLDENLVLTDQIDPAIFYGEDVVFGWDAQSADQCRENEIFVEEDQFCYLSSSVEGIDFTDGGVEEFHHSYEEDEDKFRFVYEVAGDEITLLDDMSEGLDGIQNKSDHNIIWQKFIDLIPSDQRSKFGEFRVYYNDNSGTLAYVQQINDDLSSWRLAVNAYGLMEDGKFVNERDFEHTLIHEFAHVMTLNDNQLNSSISLEECFPNYFPGEGCSNTGSFINQFVKKFWSPNMIDTLNSEGSGESIYLEKPDFFVTDYAATNPGEDIAESFTYFVLKPTPECGSDIKVSEQKICMFYDYATLKDLRLEIREKL